MRALLLTSREDGVGLLLRLRLDRERLEAGVRGLGRGAVALRDQRLHELVMGERVLRLQVDRGAAFGNRARRLLLLDQRPAEIRGERPVLWFELARLLLG